MLVRFRYALLVIAIIILIANIALAGTNLGKPDLSKRDKGINGTLVALNALALAAFVYLFNKHVLKDAAVVDVDIQDDVTGGSRVDEDGWSPGAGSWDDGDFADTDD